MMAEYTFGSSKSAVKLVQMLNERQRSSVNRRVANFINSKYRLIKAIESVPNYLDRLNLAQILVVHINNGRIPTADTIVETHAKNVAITAVRQRLMDKREIGETMETSSDEFEFEDSIVED